MPLPYRLRQIAFVTSDLERATSEMKSAFGNEVVYRDPSVAKYGLVNALFQFGDGFLELVQPLDPGVSAARHHKRLGGDGGYMLIFQGQDALADRKRLVARGLTVIEAFGGTDASPKSNDPEIAKRIEELSARYAATHFHPRDFAGLLVSLDSVTGLDWKSPYGFWPPAEMEGAPKSDAVKDLGFAEIVIDHPDAAGASKRWTDLLGGLEFTGCKVAFRQSESNLARISEIRARGVKKPVTVAGVSFTAA